MDAVRAVGNKLLAYGTVTEETFRGRLFRLPLNLG